jgi:hypothetical protein
MLSLVLYFRLVASFFAYFATVLEVLTVIFALMTCITSTRRFFFGCATFGVLVDILVASLISYTSQSSLSAAERYPQTAEINLVSYVILVGTLLGCYILIRMLPFSINQEINMWNEKSVIIRACYIIQFLFSGVAGLFLLFELVVLIVIILLLWNAIIWPFHYLINDKNSLNLVKNSMINVTAMSNTTAILNTTINATQTT